MAAVVEILLEHLDEIGFLWSQRADAISSPDYREQDVQELDHRIAAHLDGLLVAGDQCFEVAAPRLGEEDKSIAFAAAWCLAQLGAFERIFNQLEQCNLDAVIEAFCHCCIDSVQIPLKEIYQNADADVASAIGLILATHQKSLTPNRLLEFLGHDDPRVRERAWNTISRSPNA
ncbi:hypothetical protein Mal15_25180 [Stieleria maiorica]|uniref:HEAT repeat domain-containing protein n=1 Tax=Stieleria maiorica TaxID=2795974 RepID=A0A5B9ME05_9BACT|nr:hypothetical protein [Stieleria maiorica]QEF98466.1 hypothetical protein Mal15_25180 [Stieleria maiorica]